MEIQPNKALAFSGLGDYEFLDSLDSSLRTAWGCEAIMSYGDYLTDETGSSMYSGPVSSDDLRALMNRQADEHLGSVNIYADPISEAIMRVRAREAEVVYILEPHWTAAVLTEALLLAEDSTEARDELLGLMIDGQTPESKREALQDGFYDTKYAHEIDTIFAQEKFELTKHAGKTLLKLVVELNLG